MEGRLREEEVTRLALTWLRSRQFQILHFDYPGSGTGKALHPNSEFRTTKNAGVLIPDIIAHRSTSLTFFENKVRFAYADVEALLLLRDSGRYSSAVDNLRKRANAEQHFVGIALMDTANNRRRLSDVATQLDFAAVVNHSGSVCVLYEPAGLFH
jgi:hypothetical protein